MKRSPLGLFLLFVPLSCSKPADPAGPKPTAAPLRVVVLHTSDLHGRVDRLPSLTAFIRQEQSRLAAAGVTVLHVDTGDIYQGTPEGDFTKGRGVVDAFNAMGIDALVPGNHDFDQGPKVTEELARASRFPFLAANLRAGRGPPDWVRPSLVRPDLRLEILGLAPDAMDRISTRRAREGLAFKPAAEGLTRHSWTPGCARIVATHLGLDADRGLPLQGVAAVLGGHTHVEAVERLPGGALLLHSGSHGRSIGRLELEIDADSGRVLRSRADVIDVPESRDAEIEEIIEAKAGDIRRSMAEPVGRLEADLLRGGPDFDGASSPLGNHLADLAREAAEAEAAVILRSSIRSSLFAGAIKKRDLYEATPFPDTIVAVTMTGSGLRAALERAMTDDRLLVEVSGIDAAYDRAAARGARIRTIEVAGTPLIRGRRYRVATLSFMAEPGGLFSSGTDPRNLDRTLFDLQLDEFRLRKTICVGEFKPRLRLESD